MKRYWLLLILLLGMGGVLQASAQDGGRGVVREGNAGLAQNFSTFNPLFCNDGACRRINNLLFPSLFGVDLETGQYRESGWGGVAAGWTFDLGGDTPTLTVTVRDDLRWSDGTPIRAADVLFTADALLEFGSSGAGAAFVEVVERAELIDQASVRFTLKQAVCSAIEAVDIPILPLHAFDPAYAETITNSDDAYSFRYLARDAFDRAPTITASPVGLRFANLNPTDAIQLVSADGELAYEYVDVANRDLEVDLFLRGDLNFISNPPFERRADILAGAERGDVQWIAYPGSTWYAIQFNLADPDEPRPAFDEDGVPLEQGIHPLFGDVRVRRALQLGLDVPALIEAGVQGFGTAVAANQVPGSWAVNGDLAPIGYDPVAADRLLTEAGWFDENGDGIRECVRCTTAEPGTRFSFTLLFPDSLTRFDVLSSVIRQQWAQLGVNVDGTTTGSPESQDFSAALVSITENYPVEPDQRRRFTRQGDVVFSGANVGSYYNPEVESLLTQAASVPDCAADVRADLYQQAQTLIQADQPYAWLFVVDQLLAARTGVQNFAPYPQLPFWNLDQWIVINR
ncbi:MAG: ABC transporter substrate-binding protein [bacterium]|nr:ABC transporter substrate-binding protein [bacterium]